MEIKESPTFKGIIEDTDLTLAKIPENKYSLSDEGQLSPTFADNRKDTAFFGNKELSQTQEIRRTINFSPRDSLKSKVILSTVASKKSSFVFYSKREIMLFSDGSFAYKRKNNSDKIKLHIKPVDIIKLSRSGNVLTI